MTDAELHWLAGLMEGEGSFMRPAPSKPCSAIVALIMTDEDVVARAAALLGMNYRKNVSRNQRWKDTYSFRVQGIKAELTMRMLRPLMGGRRQQQIDDALAARRDALAATRARPRLSVEEQETVVRLYESGVPAPEIARQLGMVRENVYRVLKRTNHGVHGRVVKTPDCDSGERRFNSG